MTDAATATDELFDLSISFDQLGLHEDVLRGIAEQGFEHPTKVQAALIPVALSGRDVLGQSRTGSGKTAAFGLPLVHKLLTEPGPPIGALVLTPTRELAVQVAHEIRNLSRFTKLRVVPVYGGQRMTVQIPKLKKGPDIVVGTPGRVMDFHRRGLLPYDNLRLAVLDEVDRMLDIGFRDDIRKILGSIRHKHQTLFVSATISSEIERLARQYLKKPEKLVLTSGKLTVDKVTQHFISIEPWDKNRLLVHMLKTEDPELTLVFCRTKQTVDGLADYLKRKKIDAHAIHGDMYQGKRNRVIEKLRKGELRVLVASDLAARGLDVDDISHVVNYDLPDDPEMYVHRIGRTARAGRQGMAWSLVTPGQGDLLTSIEMLTNVEVTEISYKDFKPGPVPEKVLRQREEDAKRTEAHRQEFSRTKIAPPSARDATDEHKFPGGAVPAQMPAKRMGGRFRTRRR